MRFLIGYAHGALRNKRQGVRRPHPFPTSVAGEAPVPYNGLEGRAKAVDLAKIRKKSRSGQAGSKTGADPEREPESVRAEPAPAPLAEEPEREGMLGVPPEVAPALPDQVAVVSLPEIPQEDLPSVAGERLLVFDLDGEKYAIPIHEIAQIIHMPRATPVPNAPPFLKGIFSLRGRIVSIIDVAKRLGLDRPPPEDPKVVVLDMGADHFGLLVDRIDLVVEVNLGALEPVPEGFKPILQEFVEGVFHHKGRAVGFLNLPMFLAFDV